MKILERITSGLFLLVLAAFIGTKIYSYQFIDSTPPVIICDSDVIEVTVGASDEELLQGITASDDVDGDLSNQVMVKGITQLLTDDTAKVSYIVFDSSHNMTTASRTVRYTNYEKPHFALSAPLVYAQGEQVTLLDRLTAHDVIDGNISKNIRVVSQNLDTNSAGTYQVTVQVTNSSGNVSTLPLKVVITGNNIRVPAVTLTNYLVYLNAGTAFVPQNYIRSSVSPETVAITSDVNMNTPGVYHVGYSSNSYTVYLTVVVK